jgi:hypothetical protein
MPFLAVERNPPVPLERLLRRAHVVFPFLPEAQAVNYAVNAVVTNIGVYLLDERVEIDGSERSPRKKIFDRAAEDRLVGFSLRAESKDSILCGAKLTREFLSRDGERFTLPSSVFFPQAADFFRKGRDLFYRHRRAQPGVRFKVSSNLPDSLWSAYTHSVLVVAS